MKNRIDIVVRGITSCGKTAIIAEIYDFLKTKGFIVSLSQKEVADQIKYEKEKIEKEFINEDPVIIIHELNVPRK